MEQTFVRQEHASLTALVAIMRVENARVKIVAKIQIATNVLAVRLANLDIKRNLKHERR